MSLPSSKASRSSARYPSGTQDATASCQQSTGRSRPVDSAPSKMTLAARMLPNSTASRISVEGVTGWPVGTVTPA